MRFAPHSPDSAAHEATQGARNASPRPLPSRGADLTQNERRALHLAARRGGAAVAAPFTKVDRTQIGHVTAARLEAAGLLVLGRAERVVLVRGARSPAVSVTALPSKRGRSILNETLPEVGTDRDGVLEVVRLKVRHGVTTKSSNAVRGEDEVVSSVEHRDRLAEQVRLAQQNRRREAQRASERARRAA